MATAAENDQEDCQMQPLDLSCPKNTKITNTNHSTITSDEDEISVSESPNSNVSGLNLVHPNFHHRPRSSSGGSDESGSEFEPRQSPRDLVKAALLLKNSWPQAAALSPVLALDGPARKRFLTKYLHKNGEKFLKTDLLLYAKFAIAMFSVSNIYGWDIFLSDMTFHGL